MGEDETLPAAFRSADQASLSGQRTTLASVRWSLLLGLVAAATGVWSWRVGAGDLDVLAGLGAVAFLGASAFSVRSGSEAAQERWYQGRAVAESVKTLAWSYAVGAHPFPLDEPGADRRFLDRLQELVRYGGKVELVSVAGPQITPEMHELRLKSTDDRRSAYLQNRIQQQAEWYGRKAMSHSRLARRWLAVTVGANLAGLAGAVARFVGLFDLDVLGLMAAVAGSATAWSQLRQHRTLTSSYGVAAQELTIIGDRLRTAMTEHQWAAEAADAEEAISREHTLWLARHGHARP